MPVDIGALCGDLAAETEVLLRVLRSVDADGWATPTPAEGWNVLDQLGHLWYFDGAVTHALQAPDRFRSERDVMMRGGGGGFVDSITAGNRSRSSDELLRAFEVTRATMVAAFTTADPTMRVPWYGPDMSVASALTARIMETWAHGQDVYDGLRVEHTVTPALRQVAHIGVRALANSFVTKGLPVPDEPVRVELVAPDGPIWTWGPAAAPDRVTGSAVGFGLVVTQRRHILDTDVVADGPVATQWMAIAQAFAGNAGSGRRPGQFA